MPRDDERFFADMSASAEAFDKASRKCLGGIEYITPEQITPRMTRLQTHHGYFNNLGRISGGTEPVIERIRGQILPRLKQYEGTATEGPIPVILRKLDEWDGPAGSAGYGFRNTYLPGLAASLTTKYSVMQSMAAIMLIQEGIIDQARQKYLDLLDETIRAYDASSDQRENRASSVAQLVVNVVGGVSSGLSVGALAGPVGAATLSAITGIGAAIDAATKPCEASGWIDITEDSLGKLDAVVAAIEEEADKVASVLDQVMVYTDGKYSDQLLAPEVTLPD